DDSDAVSGIFSGLPSASTVPFDGNPFKIFYDGGDGNDVVLISRPVPATTYADDSWASLAVNTIITDADPVTAGNQTAIIGYDAFSTINAALSAVNDNGEVFVNAGTYAEAVSLTNGKTLRLLGSDAGTAATVSINSMSGDSTAGVDLSVG